MPKDASAHRKLANGQFNFSRSHHCVTHTENHERRTRTPITIPAPLTPHNLGGLFLCDEDSGSSDVFKQMSSNEVYSPYNAFTASHCEIGDDFCEPHLLALFVVLHGENNVFRKLDLAPHFLEEVCKRHIRCSLLSRLVLAILLYCPNGLPPTKAKKRLT
jgi:hypothetical protein